MIACVFQKYPENLGFQLHIILQKFTHDIYYFLKKQPTFSHYLFSFLFINITLRINNLKTRIATNTKLSVFVLCVDAIIYLLLYNFHDCTFSFRPNKSLV